MASRRGAARENPKNRRTRFAEPLRAVPSACKLALRISVASSVNPNAVTTASSFLDSAIAAHRAGDRDGWG